ncbi:RNase adapter RapZ [Nocardiopsis sp. NPDC006198]|uniref:RapZ C-terminal domain-containing protein n=1 Tax=Nocardiopsis sp. NPDC006198 TaxID=3154472 RepID=UPI0033B1024E
MHNQPPPEVTIISFGFLHSPPPAHAHLVIDLRTHFRDPHVGPQLRELTSSDPRVREHVLATEGVRDLVHAIALAAVAMASGPARADLVIAIGCAGGRRRPPPGPDRGPRRRRAAGGARGPGRAARPAPPHPAGGAPVNAPTNPYRPHPDASALTAARIVHGNQLRAYTVVESARGWQGIEHALRTAWKVGRICPASTQAYALLDVLNDDDSHLQSFGIPTRDAFRWYHKLGLRVLRD